MKRYIFAGTALVGIIVAIIFVTGGLNAQEVPPTFHGFFGTITYTNCDCIEGSYADRVYVKELPNGTPKFVGVICGQGDGTYDTEASAQLVFAPGDYQVWVEFDEYGSSECETSNIEEVEHGYSKQEVNITVYGPTGGGSR